MFILRVLILAVVQGVAELLPVSSSAHVIVAEKLMGMNPSAPEMTLLLVMLHTGTMLAVIWYFWKQWQQTLFQSAAAIKRSALLLALATGITGVGGEILIKIIEVAWFHNAPDAEVEQLFSHLELIAPALGLAGVLIVIAGLLDRRRQPARAKNSSGLEVKHALMIGAVQAFCLPFRGFSRSGATISTGMLSGVTKERAEEFSFALAVILTPPVIAREGLRLIRAVHETGGSSLASAVMPSIVGACGAFLAGLLALRWLSRWLESGRWYLFGVYCLTAAGAIAILHHVGY
jgi:undecaprenyl-diphosphatase